MRRRHLLLAAALAVLLPGADARAHRAADAEPHLDAYAWSFEPWVTLPLLLTGALYLIGLRRLWSSAGTGAGLRRTQALCYGAGWLTAAAALVTPIDTLGSELFWVHMVQHELLMLVAAPLLVLGRPLPAWLWALPARWRRPVARPFNHAGWLQVWRALGSPFGAWLLHALVVWVWHVPLLFEAAVRHEPVHVLQHLSFLASALLFWWSVLRQPGMRSHAPAALLSVFTTGIHTAVLGALLTFSSVPWYPVYAASAAALGMDPLEDQQLGGLVMWVPGGLAYLAATLALAARLLDDGTGAVRAQLRGR